MNPKSEYRRKWNEAEKEGDLIKAVDNFTNP